MAKHFTKKYLRRYWKNHLTVLHSDAKMLEGIVGQSLGSRAMQMVSLVKSRLLLASIEGDAAFYGKVGVFLGVLRNGDGPCVSTAYNEALDLVSSTGQKRALMDLYVFWSNMVARDPRASRIFAKMLAEAHPNNAYPDMRGQRPVVIDITAMGRESYCPD